MDRYPNRQILHLQDCDYSTLYSVPEGYLQSFLCTGLSFANSVFKCAQMRVKQDLPVLDAEVTEQSESSISLCFLWTRGNYLRDSDISQYICHHQQLANGEPFSDFSKILQSKESLGEISIDSIGDVFVQCRLTHPNTCQLLDATLIRDSLNALKILVRTESWLGNWKSSIIYAKYETLLVRALKDIAASLLEAKSKGLAHNNIGRKSIVIGLNGVTKVTNFKHCKPNNTEFDYFAEDVHRIGKTVAKWYKLLHQIFSADYARYSLPYSKGTRKLIYEMMAPNPFDRPTLEQVHERACQLTCTPLLQDVELLPSQLRSFKQARIEHRQDFQSLASTLQARWSADRNDLRVGLQLAEVLCLNLARFNEAVTVLQECMKVAITEYQQWEVRTAQVGVMMYRGDYRSAEFECISMLNSFPDQIQDDELYWKLIYYLAESCRNCRKYGIDPGDIIVFKQRRFAKKTPMGRVYRGLAKIFSQPNYRQNTRRLHKELVLCLQHCPTSILTAISLYQLSYRCDLQSVNKLFLKESLQLLEEYYPKSADYANVLGVAVNNQLVPESMIAECERLVDQYYSGTQSRKRGSSQ